MKNIHILPTDKPSRLVIDTIANKFCHQSILHNKTVNVLPQNIYITNDEAIKEGDIFIHPDGIIERASRDLDGRGISKIVLTTDQDLISDGVQAIDDEFLEWFVKNPSCEEVDVEKESHIEIEEVSYEGDFQNIEYINYKITIPKKEPKQDLEKEMFELEQQLNIPSFFRWYNSKPNQETLEEVISKNGYHDKFSDDLWKEGVEFGVKWQQKGSYSEEEVMDIIDSFIDNLEDYTPTFNSRQEWFEQFKKK